MPAILIAVALGAAGAFMFDPQQGRRRRALLRDRIAGGLREGREFGEAAAKDLRARARGAVAQARALRGGPVSDDVLVGRLRARLGRHVSHRRAVHVKARDGVVTLTGDVLAGEHLSLVRALRLVPGAKDVEDRLDVHPSAEGISALQGGTVPSGEPIELLQSRWAPGTRAVIGGAGVLLLLYGIARGGAVGVAAVAGGATLLARAKANRPLQEVMRKASQPEPRKEVLAAA